jgi:hypothetical protein
VKAFILIATIVSPGGHVNEAKLPQQYSSVSECTKSAEAIKHTYLRVSHQMPDHFSYRCVAK